MPFADDRVINRLLNKIKSVIRLGVTDSDVNERGSLPFQKVRYLGKSAGSVPLYPYGFYARTRAEVLSLVLSYGGRSENRWHIASSAERHPTDLAQDEVVLFHPFTRSEVRLKNNGDIVATATTLRVEGNLAVSGNITTEGNIVADGAIDADGEVTAISSGTAVTVSGHGHPQGNDSGGDTQVNTSPGVG